MPETHLSTSRYIPGAIFDNRWESMNHFQRALEAFWGLTTTGFDSA